MKNENDDHIDENYILYAVFLDDSRRLYESLQLYILKTMGRGSL